VTRQGRVFVNPGAGSTASVVDDLRGSFPDGTVEEVEPDDLATRVEHALATGDVDYVGIAGGDGTIRCAVEVVVRSRPATAVLVVPAGTRNHFAGDLGITDIDRAVDAAREGHTRQVDVATVNDAVFVNNSSIGMYPNLVAVRERHEERLPKRLANVVAAWHQLRNGHHLDVEVDGAPRRVWAVFVGNGCYGDTLRDLTGRDRLDEGVLDVRIARADGRLSRLRIAAAVLFGRVARSPLIERHRRDRVTVDTGGRIDVALDGEVVTLTSPLVYRSCPGALRVLVSEGE